MRVADWMERVQVPLYLAALGLGAGVGLALPSIADPAEVAINPVLGLLLFATFLGVPFTQLRLAWRDWRFLGVVMGVNFLLAPLVVFILSRVVAGDQALLVGVLLVLLTPCIDYVIVFTGLAGGAKDRLLAAAPLLMLAQMLLLPLYLWAFAGGEVVAQVEIAPFVEAFVVLILIPLAAAALVQVAAGRGSRAAGALERMMLAAMVPLMMLTLAVVVASQVARVGERLSALAALVPIYVAFAVIMAAVGAGVSRRARLGVPEQRAVAFSGATRNSLVVLPLALALPAGFALAPLAVVTQTLVELVMMVIFVRLVPRLIPHPPG